MKYLAIGGFGLLVVSLLTACGGETLIEDRHSLEYLDVKAGKPLIYPEGVDRPERVHDYDIPKLESAGTNNEADINELVKPPRLVEMPEEKED